jgi:transcriptional antiterminator RfaH
MELTTVSCSPELWYVVYCKPGKELYTAGILENQLGLTTYLPEIEVYVRQKKLRIPFFSCYFFIQMDLQKVAASRIKASPGVLKLLDFGEGPQPVSQELIRVIREVVEKKNMYNDVAHRKLAPGDSVQVISGPLEGLKAVFMESATSGARAQVLLHFLGRLSKVQVDTNLLEKVDEEVPSILENRPCRQERRTRGKGRRIRACTEP